MNENVKLLLRYGLIVFVTGTASLLLMDLIDGAEAAACEGCAPSEFAATCLMQVVQCAGETLCLVPYYVDKMVFDQKYLAFQKMQNEALPEARWYHWIIPAVMDSIGTYTVFAAAYFLNSTTVHMVRCSSLLLTALTCIILFKRDIRLTSWIGLLIITLGQVLMSIDESMDVRSPSLTNYRNAALGFVILVVGVILTGLFYVYEEYMWTKYRFNPIRGVGLYGFEAALLGLVGMVGFHLAGVENIKVTTYQLFHSPRLSGLCVLFIIIIAILNAGTLIASGLGSALFTATLLAARNVPTWILGIFDGQSHVSVLSVVGIICICFGFAFYTNLFSNCLPACITEKLQSDLRMQCFLLYEDEELEEESTTFASSTTHADSLSDAVPHRAKTTRNLSSTSSICPQIVGGLRVTNSPSVFYSGGGGGGEDDTQWVYYEKTITLER